jgi:hypothetical protein
MQIIAHITPTNVRRTAFHPYAALFSLKSEIVYTRKRLPSIWAAVRKKEVRLRCNSAVRRARDVRRWHPIIHLVLIRTTNVPELWHVKIRTALSHV